MNFDREKIINLKWKAASVHLPVKYSDLNHLLEIIKFGEQNEGNVSHRQTYKTDENDQY